MSFKIVRPMLACPYKDMTTLLWPQLATPKLDGLRCLMVEGKAVTRKLKTLPNKSVRTKLERHFPDNFDGELMAVLSRTAMGSVEHFGSFNVCQSAFMSEDGEPDWMYMVFDIASQDPYSDRMLSLKEYIPPNEMIPHFMALLPRSINGPKELQEYEEACVQAGYEGVMIRSPNGPYKMGRSTSREGYLQKIKRFEDDEAVVLSVVERLHNTNEQTKNELGYSKRSTKKEGMIAAGTLGALQVRMKDGREFQVGTGFTDNQRLEIWQNQDKYIGKTITFKSQPFGKLNLPRFPIWKGWRDERDISD